MKPVFLCLAHLLNVITSVATNIPENCIIFFLLYGYLDTILHTYYIHLLIRTKTKSVTVVNSATTKMGSQESLVHQLHFLPVHTQE